MHTTPSNPQPAARLARHMLLAAAALAVASGALAQGAADASSADKTVVAEPVAALPTFTNWLGSLPVVPMPATSGAITTLPFPVGEAIEPFEPAPVIMAAPEYPLLGMPTQGARGWAGKFNYQGLQVRLLTADAAGRRIEARSLASQPRPGERFKIRVTATYDAVADLGLVVGDPWASRRGPQIYPQPGQSVELKAGEVVDLPVEPRQFLVMGDDPAQRLLLSVRHAGALGDARSSQPVYRQDGAAASHFLQLVPAGHYPAIEQLLVAQR